MTADAGKSCQLFFYSRQMLERAERCGDQLKLPSQIKACHICFYKFNSAVDIPALLIDSLSAEGQHVPGKVQSSYIRACFCAGDERSAGSTADLKNFSAS